MPDRSGKGERELCCSNHFYAAYVFDQAETHRVDISVLIEEAGRLGYPARYWWLSQAMDIQNGSDRLIGCVHHPRNDENAGMDLYDALQARQVSYDELDAAVVEEYVYLGRRIADLENIDQPDGLRCSRLDESESVARDKSCVFYRPIIPFWEIIWKPETQSPITSSQSQFLSDENTDVF